MEKNEPPKLKTRLKSLDALRGFDMFWIIGGDWLLETLVKTSSWKGDDFLAEQVHHAPWAGVHFYDLIFPLFMFLAGVSIPYAIIAKKESGTPVSFLQKKILRRAVILILLGLVYNRILTFNFADFRYASVLGQIGIAYGVAATVALRASRARKIFFWILGIVSTYTVLQLLVPVPGYGAGILQPEGSINGYIDGLFLPGRLHGGTFDPEGLMSIFSASAITLLGALTGILIRNPRYDDNRKVLIMIAGGLALLIAGIVISPWYPPIKKIWTTTFNLISGGYSLLILALFYYIIDVRKNLRWSFFFRVIGLNSITIYLGMVMISFFHTSKFFFSGLAGLAGKWEVAVIASGLIFFEWLFLWFLYKKNVFLKV
jgi:predicted acyltransferase